MPFRFRLRDPPSDVAFLSLVDGETLYNADGAATRDVKEATIRQMGWHRVELPQDWFLSRHALDTSRQLVQGMQCTMQYLKYCCKNEERRAQKATAQLRRCEEELIELRECVAVYKQQLRELRQERQRARSTPSRAPLTREGQASHSRGAVDTVLQLACSFCGNVYPSRHAVESHIRKRHKRLEGCAVMAAGSAAVSLKQFEAATQAPTSSAQAPPGGLFVDHVPTVLQETADKCGDRGLRKEISELRLAVAKLMEQQAALQRGMPPSYVAAAPKQSAGEAVTAGEAVASSGPLSGLQQRGSRLDEEDILLRIHRELLRTGAELQQLQSAVGRESEQGRRSAADDRGSCNLRNDLPRKQAQQQHRDPLAAPRSTRAALTLDPQSVLHGPPRTEGSDGGEAARRRGSAGESLVVVSPITPPAAARARTQHALANREDITAALKQKDVEELPLMASESPCGILSGPGASLETKPPAGAMSTMSPFPSSALGLPFGGNSVVDAAGAARITGDRSPDGLGATTRGGDGEQTASREPGATQLVLPSSASQSYLPWMRPESATARFGRADPASANRYGSAPIDEATSWTRGLLLPAAEKKVPAQLNLLPAFTRRDATPTPSLAAAEVMTNSKRELIPAMSTGAPRHRSFLESSEAALPGEACRRSSGATPGEQVGASAVHMVSNQHQVARDEERGRTQLAFCEQTLPGDRVASVPVLSVPGSAPFPGSAAAGAERPQCSQAAAPGAGVGKGSNGGDVRESLTSRPHVPVVRAQHSLAATVQTEHGSTSKMIPAVHLVPAAASESGDASLQDPQKRKEEHVQGERPSFSAFLPQATRGLDESRQQSAAPQPQPLRSGDEDSSESKAGAEDTDSYSVEIPPLEASEQGDADDGPCSVPLDATVEEGSNVNEGFFGHLVMEDVSSDKLADPTPYAVDDARATRLPAFGARDDDIEEDASRFMSYNLARPTDGGASTPSQADRPTPESIPAGCSYYTYSYSYSDDDDDDEEAEEAGGTAQEGIPVKLRVNDGGKETQQASAIHDSAAAGFPESTFHADVTPVAHAEWAPTSGEVAAQREDVGKAGAEKLKKSRQGVKGNARLSAAQQGAPSPKQQPPARVGRGGKPASEEPSIVARRHSSQPSDPAPQQVVKKGKGFLAKFFSKKGK
ncbi:zinc-finger protein conserved [Leishmania donovani]|uniref:Zinc-finger_protein_conserved/GeneDB:LmjF.30.2340 n=1 Tax=Leishmania donovani TaxID=5661 RepID=A0A6J8FKP3_LEIDO|nr:zinc-finger protein conserved [Leishmania donovani]VDZ46875.1 zinc-finger_protein_conserved/GeneDB:LmjF.30.2340 [Leishmania donovani]